jgi:hypothetical protein
MRRSGETRRAIFGCGVATTASTFWLRTSLGLPENVPGIVMAIHTFGEDLDFHPQLHALVADGLFARSGVFHVMPETGLKPLEELFRARVIRFLVDKVLLPSERARMVRGWVHSGFNVHRGPRSAFPRGHGTARPIHHRQSLFGRKDAGDRAEPGFGIRINPLALWHEQEDRAQLRGLHPLRL